MEKGEGSFLGWAQDHGSNLNGAKKCGDVDGSLGLLIGRDGSAKGFVLEKSTCKSLRLRSLMWPSRLRR